MEVPDDPPPADPPHPAPDPPRPRQSMAGRLVSGLFAPRARPGAAGCLGDGREGQGAARGVGGGAGQSAAGLGDGRAGEGAASLGDGRAGEGAAGLGAGRAGQRAAGQGDGCLIGAGQGAAAGLGAGGMGAGGLGGSCPASTVGLGDGGANQVEEGDAVIVEQSGISKGNDEGTAIDHRGGFDSIVKLEIKLLCNVRMRRKEFKCWCFEMGVDSDRTNYMDFVDSVVNKYPHGYMEVVHVQYYDAALKTFPEITCDQDLMSMFSKHCKSKPTLIFFTYRAPSDPFEPVTQWEFDDDSQPTNDIEVDEDNYLRNPKPQKEHVGVDEEAMYLETQPQRALQVVNYPIENRHDDDVSEDGQAGDDSDDDDAEEEDEVQEEDELPCNEGNAKWNMPEPPMKEGTTYSSMVVFRLAMSQHVIKKQYEFNTAKSGPQRFRAKSAHSSIVPFEGDAPAASMSLLPSQTLETTSEKKRSDDCTSEACKSQSFEISSRTKGKTKKSSSGLSKSSKSGSNQPEPLSLENRSHKLGPIKPKVTKKVCTMKKKVPSTKNVNISPMPLDSPAMGTRSKKKAAT